MTPLKEARAALKAAEEEYRETVERRRLAISAAGRVLPRSEAEWEEQESEISAAETAHDVPQAVRRVKLAREALAACEEEVARAWRWTPEKLEAAWLALVLAMVEESDAATHKMAAEGGTQMAQDIAWDAHQQARIKTRRAAGVVKALSMSPRALSCLLIATDGRLDRPGVDRATMQELCDYGFLVTSPLPPFWMQVRATILDEVRNDD